MALDTRVWMKTTCPRYRSSPTLPHSLWSVYKWWKKTLCKKYTGCEEFHLTYIIIMSRLFGPRKFSKYHILTTIPKSRKINPDMVKMIPEISELVDFLAAETWALSVKYLGLSLTKGSNSLRIIFREHQSYLICSYAWRSYGMMEKWLLVIKTMSMNITWQSMNRYQNVYRQPRRRKILS